MANINVKEGKTTHELVGIEYTGDTPILIMKDDEGNVHFSKLQRGVLRLDKTS